MKQTLKYILEKQIEYLKFAESKHNVSLTLASGVIVFSISFIYQKILIVSLLACGTILFCLLSVLYSFIALSAREIKIKKKRKKNQSTNLIYYKTISFFDEVNYTKSIKAKYGLPRSYKIDELDLDLARQVITTAKIADIKFSYFNISVMFLFVGILLLVLSMLVIGGSGVF